MASLLNFLYNIDLYYSTGTKGGFLTIVCMYVQLIYLVKMFYHERSQKYYDLVFSSYIHTRVYFS